MKISVIIPTYNRQGELEKCLAAIAANDLPPDEIIIVEQGHIEATRNIATTFGMAISVVGFQVKSAAQARNKGVSLATGDIFLFVDDDVFIAPDYIAIAAYFFLEHPKILGITGRDTVAAAAQKRGMAGRIKDIVAWFFWRWSYSKYNRVLISGHNVSKTQSAEEMPADWIPGLGCWRRTVFDQGFQFNNNFIRWSFGEDVMFSYEVNKAYPHSLRYLPALEYSHHCSEDIRLSNPSMIRMKIIYRYVFWYSCVYQGKLLHAFAYCWSQVGLMIFHLTEEPSWGTLRDLGQTYRYLFKNRKAIANDGIDYNEFILKSK